MTKVFLAVRQEVSRIIAPSGPTPQTTRPAPGFGGGNDLYVYSFVYVNNLEEIREAFSGDGQGFGCLDLHAVTGRTMDV